MSATIQEAANWTYRYMFCSTYMVRLWSARNYFIAPLKGSRATWS